MAQVAPFRGLHFDLDKVKSLTAVVTPPYDVIRPEEREVFAASHPHNMVHLILPQALPGDNPLVNRYTRAAALFGQWQREGVFKRDPEPALYYWETMFDHDGKRYTRVGLAALVRLEAYSKGIVHGSLSPQTIAIQDDGRVTVTDFGLAQLQSQAGVDLREAASPYL